MKSHNLAYHYLLNSYEPESHWRHFTFILFVLTQKVLQKGQGRKILPITHASTRPLFCRATPQELYRKSTFHSMKSVFNPPRGGLFGNLCVDLIGAWLCKLSYQIDERWSSVLQSSWVSALILLRAVRWLVGAEGSSAKSGQTGPCGPGANLMFNNYYYPYSKVFIYIL